MNWLRRFILFLLWPLFSLCLWPSILFAEVKWDGLTSVRVNFSRKERKVEGDIDEGDD